MIQIDIQAHNFPLTSALRSHIDERGLGFAPSVRDDHVKHVPVRMYRSNVDHGWARAVIDAVDGFKDGR